MRDSLSPDGMRRLEEYLATIGEELGHASRRASFAHYAFGLLSEGERKSVEPIAARLSPQVDGVNAAQLRLLWFLRESAWSDRAVRRAAAQYGITALTKRAPIDSWIVDDTGFLKQGSHSVGVQRQYTGSAGKVTNCQVGVSLTLATRYDHLPIDFDLYLPESWANSPARRREGRVPAAVPFKTKLELALEQIDRALADGWPRGIVEADTAYGASADFRSSVRQRGLDYAVGLLATNQVRPLDEHDRPNAPARSVGEWSHVLAAARCFRRVTWREGTRGKLAARFAARRVVFASSKAQDADGEAVWLLFEWRHGESHPTRFYALTLPATATLKTLVEVSHRRWRTERAYEDLKGELGFDHYEGRRFQGWHHHVSVALACYAFLVAERSRRFPPSAVRAYADEPQPLAA